MAVIFETPIRFIDNAPVKFNADVVKCNKDDREFCQLIQRTDKTSFQVKAPLSHNLVVNGDFMHPINQGTANSNVANKLVDTTAFFLGIENGASLVKDYVAVMPGMEVINLTDSVRTVVQSVDKETQIAFATDPFPDGNEEYIIHGWTDVSGSVWTIDEVAGTASCSGLSNTILIMDNITRRGTTHYKLVLEVTEMTTGYLEVYVAGNLFLTITENGVYTVYESIVAPSSRGVSFSNFDGFNGTLQDVQLYQVDKQLTIQVRDANDDVLAEQSSTDVDGETVSIVIDWDTAPFSTITDQEGLKICVIDNSDGEGDIASGIVEEIIDENFSFQKSEGPNDYIGTYYTRANNSLYAFWPASSPYSAPQQDIYIVNESSRGWVNGRSYTVEFYIESISAGCAVQLNYGGTLGASYTTTGLKTETVTMNVGVFLLLTTTIPSAGKSVVISSIKARFSSAEDGTPNACSECYCLKETHDNDQFCTTLFRYYGDDNQFGFNYTDTDFVQYMRLKAHLRKGKYNQDGRTFTDSVGNMSITKFNSQKFKELIIDEVPEYIHDAISVMKGHDHVFIDDVEHVFALEDYEPEWDGDNVKFARGTLEVRKKEQDLYNRNC